MSIFWHVLTSAVLVLPVPVALHFGIDLFGSHLPIGVGLCIQAVLGNIILVYVHGYEHKNKAVVFFGYFLFFAGLSGSLLAGKNVWLLAFWELTSVGILFLYAGHKFTETANRSIIALLVASGISMFLVAGWIFHSNPRTGLLFLAAGLLLKSAFLGFHFWLPEGHGGAPGHASASFSGLLVNVPLFLFMQYVYPEWKSFGLNQYLIPVAGLGVFFGGLTSFFHFDAKKSLAYSTVENLNFIWLCIFLSSFWTNDSYTDINQIGRSFYILFYIAIVHHSISKIFQFLSVGYICSVVGSTVIDECKGFGRKIGISSGVLGMGALSFAVIPGTIGFVSESTFFFLTTKILDLPVKNTAYFLPGIIFIIFGLVAGGAAHMRLFFTLCLSIPDESKIAKPNSMIASAGIKFALYALSFMILVLSFSFIFACNMIHALADHQGTELHTWFQTVSFISFISVVFFFSLAILRWGHSITKRVLWDCGSKYKGVELSIPASVISDPLKPSLGRFIISLDGKSLLDDWFFRALNYFFSIGKFWIGSVESGNVSNYLGFSTLLLLLSIVAIAFMKLV